MSNILTAIISADGKQFTKTLVDLTAQLKRFEEGLKTTTGVESIARLNRAIDATKQKIDALKSFSGFDNLNNKFGTLARSSNSANLALINTGRIFQDLPFGIIGVANNINPLLESFQRLRQESGSTGGAMKALAGSLLGGGGLGLAFSVITGALSFLAVGFSAFTRGMGENKKQVDENKVSLEQYKAIIDQIKQSVDAFVNSIEYANRIGQLRIQLGSSALLDFRGQVNEQRDLIGLLTSQRAGLVDLGIQMTRDEVQNGKDLTEAKAENQRAILDLDQKLLKATQDINALYLQQQIQRNEDAKKSADELLKIQEALIAKAKEITSRFPELVPDKIDDLFDSFKTRVSKATVIVDDFLKGFPRRIGNLRKIQVEDIEFELVSPRMKILSPDFKTDTASIERLHNALFPQKSKYQEALDFIAIYEANVRNLANIVQSTLTPAFEGFFSQLLEGTATIKSFIEGLGNAIKQLISKLAAAAVLAGIISLLTGGSGAKGGLSFLGAFKQILGFRAKGGPVRAGGDYIVGEEGPELFRANTSGMIIPNGSFGRINQSSGYGEKLVARLAGSDIEIALIRTRKMQLNA